MTRIFVADDSHLHSVATCLRDDVGMAHEAPRAYFAKWAS